MGKSSAPPPPDYAAAAKETAQGNLESARFATKANRPTQITPYGSLTWTQGNGQTGTRTFNQQRFDAAVEAANNSPGGIFGALRNAPDRNDDQFYDMVGGGDPDQWTQTVTLDPRVQETLDKQLALNNRYADLASTGLDKAYATLSDPTLDTSGVPQRAVNVGQTAQDAILARLRPEMARQEEALRTRLANQGLAAGSEAFNNDFRQFNQKQNDQLLQAALYGIGLDSQNRSQALQEQAYLQDRPLNLINALRTGAQVQNPQFQQFAQQQTTAGPNMLGAADAGYQAAVGQTNAQNAQTSGMVGGLFGLGLGLAGLPIAGGGSLGGNLIGGLLS